MKPPRRRVAPKRSRTVWLGPAIWVACGVVIALLAYELGQRRAGHNRLAAQQRYGALQTEMLAEREANATLREQVALLQTNQQINREAYRQVEGRLTELQATILQQQEDLAFYQGIISPDQAAGLRIQDFEVRAGADASSFKLRFVLAQALRSGRSVSGYLELDVEGVKDGEAVSFDLEDLADAERGRLAFSFRYFQNLETDLALPQGFAPERVKVKLTPKGNTVKAVEESFAWAVQAG